MSSPMDTQTSGSARPSFRPPGLRLALEQTTVGSSSGGGSQTSSSSASRGPDGMIQLVGGDGVDLAASYEVSASGTLRTQGYIIKSQGIQAAPERRPSQVAAGGAAAGQAAAATPAPVSSSLASGGGVSAGEGVAQLNPSDFRELGTVGKGACGIVRRALHVPSLRVYALKEINIFDKEKRRQFVRELQALGCIASPYIVAFAGAWYAEGSITLLLEYANRHSLLEVLKVHGALDERLVQRIALHTFRGLDIMHKARCIHRDIKPGNILINSAAECKLTDFGVVTALEGTMDLATTFVGTTIFMAPERVSQEGRYSFSSDVWSLGVSLWYLAVGRLPYPSDAGYWGIVKSIRDDPVPQLPPLHPVTNQPYSDAFRDFLSRALQKDPAARATAATMLQHPFLRGAEESWNAALRSAPDGVLHPLMRLSDSDLSDLDAVLQALYAGVYARALGPQAAEFRSSLMDQARLQRLADGINNPLLPVATITQRFKSIYDANRAQGL